MSHHNPVQTDYPEDGWLRGYFNTVEADRVDGSRTVTAWRKNVDFLRLRDVALHLLEPASGKVILDVGCADGATMVYCGLQGAIVHGQDLNPDSVAEANRLLKRFGIEGEAHCGDAAELSFPDNYFDGVISSDFFEHITDDVKVRVLRESFRVLKPGCPLVIKTPNLAYLKLALRYKQLRGLMRLQNPRKFVIPHTPGTDDPQHIGLISRWELTRTITAAGFLNYQFYYAPLRRFGASRLMEILSTEIPIARDILCEDVICKIYKPIVLSHFPD
jgi:2-polyprenyl-3-methyl-5-hydroxy-6-metoxy-1,4-benzoquinol methylase